MIAAAQEKKKLPAPLPPGPRAISPSAAEKAAKASDIISASQGAKATSAQSKPSDAAPLTQGVGQKQTPTTNKPLPKPAGPSKYNPLTPGPSKPSSTTNGLDANKANTNQSSVSGVLTPASKTIDTPVRAVPVSPAKPKSPGSEGLSTTSGSHLTDGASQEGNQDSGIGWNKTGSESLNKSLHQRISESLRASSGSHLTAEAYQTGDQGSGNSSWSQDNSWALPGEYVDNSWSQDNSWALAEEWHDESGAVVDQWSPTQPHYDVWAGGSIRNNDANLHTATIDDDDVVDEWTPTQAATNSWVGPENHATVWRESTHASWSASQAATEIGVNSSWPASQAATEVGVSSSWPQSAADSFWQGNEATAWSASTGATEGGIAPAESQSRVSSMWQERKRQRQMSQGAAKTGTGSAQPGSGATSESHEDEDASMTKESGAALAASLVAEDVSQDVQTLNLRVPIEAWKQLIRGQDDGTLGFIARQAGLWSVTPEKTDDHALQCKRLTLRGGDESLQQAVSLLNAAISPQAVTVVDAGTGSNRGESTELESTTGSNRKGRKAELGHTGSNIENLTGSSIENRTNRYETYNQYETDNQYQSVEAYNQYEVDNRYEHAEAYNQYEVADTYNQYGTAPNYKPTSSAADVASLAVPAISRMALGQSTTKKILCKFWLKGHCTKGAQCSFTHGKAEASSSNPVEASDQPCGLTQGKGKGKGKVATSQASSPVVVKPLGITAGTDATASSTQKPTSSPVVNKVQASVATTAVAQKSVVQASVATTAVAQKSVASQSDSEDILFLDVPSDSLQAFEKLRAGMYRGIKEVTLMEDVGVSKQYKRMAVRGTEAGLDGVQNHIQRALRGVVRFAGYMAGSLQVPLGEDIDCTVHLTGALNKKLEAALRVSVKACGVIQMWQLVPRVSGGIRCVLRGPEAAWRVAHLIGGRVLAGNKVRVGIAQESRGAVTAWREQRKKNTKLPPWQKRTLEQVLEDEAAAAISAIDAAFGSVNTSMIAAENPDQDVGAAGKEAHLRRDRSRSRDRVVTAKSLQDPVEAAVASRPSVVAAKTSQDPRESAVVSQPSVVETSPPSAAAAVALTPPSALEASSLSASAPVAFKSPPLQPVPAKASVKPSLPAKASVQPSVEDVAERTEQPSMDVDKPAMEVAEVPENSHAIAEPSEAAEAVEGKMEIDTPEEGGNKNPLDDSADPPADEKPSITLDVDKPALDTEVPDISQASVDPAEVPDISQASAGPGEVKEGEGENSNPLDSSEHPPADDPYLLAEDPYDDAMANDDPYEVVEEDPYG